MNKVFKVIWSEARNAYVVVSEIAKNHGSKSCSTKKLLTMLIATGVMTCASMAPAMAAPNVDASATVNVGKKAAVNVAENAKVNVKKDAKVNVEESAELTVKNGAKVTFSKDAGIGFENGAKINLGSKAGVTLADGAKLSVAKGSNVSVDKNITMGNGAVSSPYVGQTGNVAIGEKALAWNGNGLQEALMDFGQGGAKVKTFFGFPYGAEIVDGTKLPGSIAIGKNTVARSGSTMIGDHGYTGKIGDTTITPDGNGIMKYNNDVYSTTIGANSFNSGALASVTGVFSIASSKFDGGDSYKSYAVQNTGATIYGSMNSIESATSDAEYSGIASSVLGFANKTQNANAALIWGTGNEVTNSVESIDIDYNGWNKLSVAEAQQKAIEAMQSSKYAGGSVMAIGGGNKADYAKYSQLTGVQNKVTGTAKAGAKYDFVNGYQNTVTNASYVTVIGIKNKVTADGNKVIGDNQKVSGKNNVIFGSADKVTETTVNNAVVLGHNAKVTGEGGVALGAGSVADRANAVSVGSKDANRQIINVAAGEADTDAVNVSQLNKVSVEAGKHTTLVAGDNVQVKEEKTDNGLKYTVSATDTTYTAGNGIAINGENNAISVKLNKDEKNLEVTADGLSLNKDLKGIESISNGNAKLALNGEAGYAGIVNGKGASVFMQDSTTVINGVVGIDQKGKISGVAEGVADNDAVNVSQLNKVSVEAGKHTTLSNGKNTTVEAAVKDGQTDYKVNVAGDLTDISSVANGDAKLALNGVAGTAGIVNGKGASVYMQDGYTVINSKVSFDQDGKISGVAAGKISADSTDAVNGSQLNAVATEAGKHSKVVNGNNTNVEETTVDGQKVYKVNLNNNIMVGDVTGKYVSISGTNGTIEATGAIATKDRVYADKGGKLADIDVTGNKISNGDAKLALNGAAGTAGIVNGKGASVYMQDGYTVINSKVSFDQNGKISGVADGVNNDDAVNVSQLKKVSETANAGWNLSTNGVAPEATNVKPGDFVDFSGDQNISVSHDGSKVKVELNKNIDVNYVQTNALNAKYNLSVGTANENGTVPFFVNSNGAFYGANGSFVVDKDGKVTATAGKIGNVVLQNGVYTGHSALRDGELFVGDASGSYSQITPKSAKLGQVTIDEKGNIAGVNHIQTNALNAKYNLSVGTANENGTVPFFVNSNGAFYAANGKLVVDKDGKVTATAGEIGNVVLNNGVYTGHSALRDGELFVGDASGNYSQITTKGAKLGQVTIAADGKISGVAAGEVSSTSTDAINGSQLHQTNVDVAQNKADIAQNKADIAQNKADIAANRADIDKNKADIAANRADIDKNKADIAANRADIDKNKADIAANKEAIDKNTADISKLDTRVTDVEALAKKHTTVTAGDNIAVTETTNKDGGKEYNVALKNNIDLGDKGSVTTGQTVMNNDGLKVGKDVSVTATAVTAGKTSISDEGVKVGDKTYISADGLNANDQKVTNVKAGDISETSKDAVNGSQLYKTNQEVANNTNRINQLGSRVNKVGAGAAALAALHPMDFDPDDKLTFSAGYGNYGGENAAAIGAYYRPDEKVMFSVGGTVGNGENMVNAGVSFSLDRTNHVSNSRTAMAREILDLRAEVTELKAMVAKGGLGSIAEDKMKIFPDVAENHWAYEYVGKLAAAGIIEGYPDGNFSGDRMMSRYEFAAMLYRAMQKGAQLDSKIINEFAPEMGRIRVDRISGEDGDRDKIERVRVNAVKGERDHYGNKIAKAEAKAK